MSVKINHPGDGAPRRVESSAAALDSTLLEEVRVKAKRTREVEDVLESPPHAVQRSAEVLLAQCVSLSE